MAARGSKIGRIREYFKSGDLDEVQVVLTLVNRDVEARTAATSPPDKTVRRRRRPRKSAAETPVEQAGFSASASA